MQRILRSRITGMHLQERLSNVRRWAYHRWKALFELYENMNSILLFLSLLLTQEQHLLFSDFRLILSFGLMIGSSVMFFWDWNLECDFENFRSDPPHLFHFFSLCYPSFLVTNSDQEHRPTLAVRVVQNSQCGHRIVLLGIRAGNGDQEEPWSQTEETQTLARSVAGLFHGSISSDVFEKPAKKLKAPPVTPIKQIKHQPVSALDLRFECSECGWKYPPKQSSISRSITFD